MPMSYQRDFQEKDSVDIPECVKSFCYFFFFKKKRSEVIAFSLSVKKS